MKLLSLFLVTAMALPALAAAPNSSPSVKLNQSLLSALGQPEQRDEAVNLGTRYAQKKLTSAQVLALNSAPILVVASPGAGKALMPIAVYATMDYNSATYVTNSNESLDIEYGGGGSGDIAASIDSAFMEATADAIGSTPAIEVVPVANTGLYAHIGGGDPTTGDSEIFIRVYYKEVPSLLTD